MSEKKYTYLMGDFETTSYEGQDHTEVWASALVQLKTEDVKIFHSIDETMEYLESLHGNIMIYYHNLKFDGEFWLSYLEFKSGYEQAVIKENGYNCDNPLTWHFMEDKEMPNNTYKYLISDMGQWYSIKIKHKGRFIEIRDSLKLLPFTVKKIGNSFETKHKKLDMEYKGYRYAGCEITDEEKAYIANDVLVMKEALEILFADGHNRLTIGACCMTEYKKTLDSAELFKRTFPNVYEIPLDVKEYGVDNAGDYIRNSYRGGWCYVVPEKSKQVITDGITADVNSLYPSMMSSESGNVYPTGMPTFWKGDYIPEQCKADSVYFFVRFRCRFYIKKNYLPWVQIKNNFVYRGNECLSTSDVYDKKTGCYYDKWKDKFGNLHDTAVTLTMTKTDYKLFLEHYEVADMKILDGCYFQSYKGLFDAYINKYRKQKMENKGAKREEAKLFLNNLYGKMAMSTNSSYKVAYEKNEGILGFVTVEENEKEPSYIPVGSAITSYSRNFTIRASQKNYHGPDKPGFIYADTDSMHCNLRADELQGIKTDDTAFCCWKLERSWDKGYFTRQKTYIEHIVKENLKECAPYWNVKCAGMPEASKQLFVKSMEGAAPEELRDYTFEEQQFLKKKRTLEDFDIGLTIPDKLRPKRIKGGIVLEECPYEMR